MPQRHIPCGTQSRRLHAVETKMCGQDTCRVFVKVLSDPGAVRDNFDPMFKKMGR